MQNNQFEKDAEVVKAAIDAQENIMILDVRTPEEVARGKIPTSINIELYNIDADIVKQLPDKTATIYTYCLSGDRSGKAASLLREFGYKNTYSIKQGMLAWRVKQFPVE